MLKARVYTSVSFSKHSLPAVRNNRGEQFYTAGGCARGQTCGGDARFIRLKPVHGNYQTKRTDNSAGRESLYGSSFCTPSRLFRHEKLKFGQVLCFVLDFTYARR